MSSVSADPRTPNTVSVARPTADATALWQPLGLQAARITGGFWARCQQANATAAIRSGLERLESAGNLQNLRIAAGQAEGDAIGPIFADSDVHKWLEAVAWEYGRSPDPELLEMQREVTAIVAAAQADDGYLDSVVQIRHGLEGRYRELPWSHEHYCAGHLMQAAVAQVRCTGDRALLEVAIKLADHLAATFGDDLRHDVDGHPVIEMGLIELFRETGTAAYLDLARYFVEARGHGLMQKYGKEPSYFSDRVPVREAISVEGHAVRAVYLTAGAADLAVELGDAALLAALKTQFAHMWGTKTYLTGGLGSRWEGEAFGDPYELPPDRGYAETCAAIGGIQWAWRMLLATGDSFYADAIERLLYNGFLAGVSLRGDEYFYVNPLQLRGDAHADENRSPAHGRRGWFDCACCPPNIMRTLSSLDGYLATYDDQGIQIHQYATGTLTGPDLAVEVATNYPWKSRILITVTDAPDEERSVAVRIPGWADGAQAMINGVNQQVSAGGYLTLHQTWAAGDVIELDLPLEPRVVAADPRVDAVRGCVAVECGPLVYAAEQIDQAAAVNLDDAQLFAEQQSSPSHRPDLLGGVNVLRLQGSIDVDHDPGSSWPYPALRQAQGTGATVEVLAIPYFAWANREIGAMRVWFPQATTCVAKG